MPTHGFVYICIVKVPPVFSLGCIKTSWGDARKFGAVFSAFIADETSLICLSTCLAISKLRASN